MLRSRSGKHHSGVGGRSTFFFPFNLCIMRHPHLLTLLLKPSERRPRQLGNFYLAASVVYSLREPAFQSIEDQNIRLASMSQRRLTFVFVGFLSRVSSLIWLANLFDSSYMYHQIRVATAITHHNRAENRIFSGTICFLSHSAITGSARSLLLR